MKRIPYLKRATKAAEAIHRLLMRAGVVREEQAAVIKGMFALRALDIAEELLLEYGREYPLSWYECLPREIIQMLAPLPLEKAIYRLDDKGLLQSCWDECLKLPEVDHRAIADMSDYINGQFGSRKGEHYTPPEVARVMAALMTSKHRSASADEVSFYDPACGYGSLLAAAHEQTVRAYPNANVRLYGQDIAPDSSALASAFLHSVVTSASKGPKLTDDEMEALHRARVMDGWMRLFMRAGGGPDGHDDSKGYPSSE